MNKATMSNPVLDDIAKYAARRISEAYDYCGFAIGDNAALITSDDKNGGEIKIEITIKAE
jgi:hypothetical protein